MVNLQEFSDVTVTVEDGQVQVDRSSDHKTKEQNMVYTDL
jgi:hypothetical protein